MFIWLLALKNKAVKFAHPLMRHSVFIVCVCICVYVIYVVCVYICICNICSVCIRNMCIKRARAYIYIYT
jgi:hypothetical protein